ncbi:MAG TPA: hypothetical protein VGO58_05980 [Chitinophagaceae bacterium]|jgi:hypothetical protein|nr:hypothetical protein [Chitinophagaceae bacterium]
MNIKKIAPRQRRKQVILFPLLVCIISLQQELPVPRQTDGFWFASINRDQVNFQFKKTESDNSLYGNDFPLNDFSYLPKDKPGDFSLTRPAGKIDFTGQFDGTSGKGKYVFTPDEDFKQLMRNEGIALSTERDMMDLYIVNVTVRYVHMLKNNGYTRLRKDEIVSLAAVGVDSGYIQLIKQAGFSRVSLQELISMRSLHIDNDMIQSIRKAGYPTISSNEIISVVSLGISVKTLVEYRETWYPNVTVQEVIEAHVAKVSPAQIKELKSKGNDTNGIRKYIRSQIALQ